MASCTPDGTRFRRLIIGPLINFFRCLKLPILVFAYGFDRSFLQQNEGRLLSRLSSSASPPANSLWTQLSVERAGSFEQFEDLTKSLDYISALFRCLIIARPRQKTKVFSCYNLSRKSLGLLRLRFPRISLY